MTRHFQAGVAHDASPTATLEVRSPFDSSLLATADQIGWEDIDRALNTAHGLFRDREAWLSIPTRLAILDRTAELLESQREAFAMDAASEGGKPLADSRIEVQRAIEGVRLAADALRNQSGKQYPMGVNAASQRRISFSTHEPIGVVVAVSAFNHPLNLIVHQVAPAVAAGCPVLVKPAAATPISCFRFVELLREAGLPGSWCQVVLPTSNAIATQMVSDARCAFLSFIGSARVGWMLRSKLAPGARCALEHGGVAPVICMEDADLDYATPLLAKGGFYHAGQVCVSVQRVYAHSSIARDLAQRLAQAAKDMKVGDPRRDDTEIGPLISASEVTRVHEWVEEAVAAGAQLICGGAPLDHQCYQPTVLLDPPDNCTISTSEVFGPVVCVYTFDDVTDALDRANALDVSFQAAAFTQDIDQAMRIFKGINASAVMINDHTAFRVDWMPFAGLRHSGHGVGGIHFTFEDMQIAKMAVLRSPSL